MSRRGSHTALTLAALLLMAGSPTREAPEPAAQPVMNARSMMTQATSTN